MHASKEGDVDAVIYLVEKGANKDIQNKVLSS